MNEERVHFDEFKLFYESTEKVIDRRLATNKWNYSISAALLFSIAIIFNWSISSPSFLIPSVFIIFILGIMGIIYSSYWIAQIKDFKQLNNAKFDVLNKMAPLISFGETLDDSRTSFRPFEKEWNILEKSKAIQKSSNSNLITMKSSNMEYIIPKSFRILYIILILVLIPLTFNADKLYTINNSKIIKKSKTN